MKQVQCENTELRERQPEAGLWGLPSKAQQAAAGPEGFQRKSNSITMME